MITIINGNNIEYTSGDTFNLSVDCNGDFDSGSTLRFQICRNENDSIIVNNTYNLNALGKFDAVLSDSDIANLLIGDYVYRMSVINQTGETTTQISGNFKVKWGA